MGQCRRGILAVHDIDDAHDAIVHGGHVATVEIQRIGGLPGCAPGQGSAVLPAPQAQFTVAFDAGGEIGGRLVGPGIARQQAAEMELADHRACMGDARAQAQGACRQVGQMPDLGVVRGQGEHGAGGCIGLQAGHLQRSGGGKHATHPGGGVPDVDVAMAGGQQPLAIVAEGQRIEPCRQGRAQVMHGQAGGVEQFHVSIAVAEGQQAATWLGGPMAQAVVGGQRMRVAGLQAARVQQFDPGGSGAGDEAARIADHPAPGQAGRGGPGPARVPAVDLEELGLAAAVAQHRVAAVGGEGRIEQVRELPGRRQQHGPVAGIEQHVVAAMRDQEHARRLQGGADQVAAVGAEVDPRGWQVVDAEAGMLGGSGLPEALAVGHAVQADLFVQADGCHQLAGRVDVQRTATGTGGDGIDQLRSSLRQHAQSPAFQPGTGAVLVGLPLGQVGHQQG